jgi:DNA-binding response OmpR family regulator
LLNLVNQLLDFRRLEVEEFKLNPAEGDIIRFIEETGNSFTDMSEKKNISYEFKTSIASFQTYFDKDKLEKILFNLLSNAFKFTPEHGKISVQLHLENDRDGDESLKMLQIMVKDTGIGIPPENQEKIFERFFQHELPGHIINQGSGIGLAITREFVKLYNGSISVESEPEKGSCFTVVLPLRKTSAEAEEEPVEIVTAPVNGEKANGTSNHNGHKRTTVLLVEDNDDFRFYLKDNLSAFYNIQEASNGKEAWQLVTTTPPDLVVSDIMMPEMNGIELSKKIRNNSQTSHIPVILLTAMASEEQQLEGFASGVNDYITKPFNFEILVSRIKNLLAQRRQMRKEFQKQLEVNPSLIAVKSIDEKFMKEAMEIVEKNISNSDFSVEELSRDLFMSRVALYKKLLALTGKTPIEFIRTIRLKRAAQLLEKSQLTISEVAYEVGFNNPKYFSRYFKEEFNALPSAYQASKR